MLLDDAAAEDHRPQGPPTTSFAPKLVKKLLAGRRRATGPRRGQQFVASSLAPKLLDRPSPQWPPWREHRTSRDHAAPRPQPRRPGSRDGAARGVPSSHAPAGRARLPGDRRYGPPPPRHGALGD